MHAHPRTKSDEQLRALAAKGGVVGIFDLPYLTASPRQPTVEDYLAHREHALKVAGEDHVGIGSDVSIEPFDTSAKGMAALRGRWRNGAPPGCRLPRRIARRTS